MNSVLVIKKGFNKTKGNCDLFSYINTYDLQYIFITKQQVNYMIHKKIKLKFNSKQDDSKIYNIIQR